MAPVERRLSKELSMDNFWLKARANTLVFLLMGLMSPVFAVAEESVCEQIQVQQREWVEARRALALGTQTFLQQGSGDLKKLYRELSLLEGQELSLPREEVLGLIELRQTLIYHSESFFNLADQDDQSFQAWSAAYPGCDWDGLMTALESWQYLSYDSLSTIAIYFSNVADSITRWLQEWSALEKNKQLVPEGYFVQVETQSNELSEAGDLVKSIFEHMEEALREAQP
jgi:hypothetical protein